jgi:ATP synthase subunit 6
LALTDKVDLSITNATLFMAIGLGIYILLYTQSGLAEGRIIPGRVQSIVESLYELVKGISIDNIGSEVKGNRYLPWVMTLFLMILIFNLVGLIPYTFSPTAQIAVALGLSISIWIGAILLGFLNHKYNFLSAFMPNGSPLLLAPFMVTLELISNTVRALSLGVRLAANITAGHILFVILAGFIWKMLMVGGIMSIISLIPLAIMLAVTVLELAVAFIQAYVFSLLTAIYISESEEMH